MSEEILLNKQDQLALAVAQSISITGSARQNDVPNTVAPPRSRPRFESSKRRVERPNGAYAICLSGEEPERARGLNIDTLWADELLRTQGRHQHVPVTRERASRASQTQQEWRHGAIRAPRCDAITRIPERL